MESTDYAFPLPREEGAETHGRVASTLATLLGAADGPYQVRGHVPVTVASHTFNPATNTSLFKLTPNSSSLTEGQLRALLDEVQHRVPRVIANKDFRELSVAVAERSDANEVTRKPTYCLAFAYYQKDDRAGPAIVCSMVLYGLVGLGLLYAASFLLTV
jgi:hypothetical protein